MLMTLLRNLGTTVAEPGVEYPEGGRRVNRRPYRDKMKMKNEPGSP